jgi:Trp operon repressor
MNDTLTDDTFFPMLIAAYRKNILLKYSEERMRKYPEYQGIPREKIDLLVRYFLELLYPEMEKRKQLDQAFAALKGFVQNPSKVFGLLGSLGVSLWKIGKYLPQAFRAGMSSLSSYITAHDMERRLLEAAKPFLVKGVSIEEEHQFQGLLALIPRAEAEKFRKDIVALFRTLTNTELVDRIILILDSLIQKMKSKPSLYTEVDVTGISLGYSILVQGKKILETLEESEKTLMISAIDQIEKDYYESCFHF